MLRCICRKFLSAIFDSLASCMNSRVWRVESDILSLSTRHRRLRKHVKNTRIAHLSHIEAEEVGHGLGDAEDVARGKDDIRVQR